MLGDNSFLKNKELHQARLEQEKKLSDQLGHGTNQAQLGKQKFQDIADQRYQANLAQLQGNKFDVDAMMEKAKKKKKGMDIQRDITFYKKWY